MASTIRQIANETGLSAATVSLALRGKGRISDETRLKVQAAARSLSYQPNPALAKAFSQMRRPQTRTYRESLAFIIEWPTPEGPEYQKKVHAAASERATALGYKLESFVLSGKPSDHRRLDRVLLARGIRGVIIIPRLGLVRPRLYLDWKHLAAVEIGRTLSFPRNLHHVETGDYHKVIEALHMLKRAGYRRIGMAIEPMHIQQHSGIYHAVYLLQQSKLPAQRRIPLLSTYGPWNEKTFQKWMRKYKPDILYVHYAPTIFRWLKNMNLKVPEDVSIFCVNVENTEYSGLRRDYAGMGRAAVDMVSLLLENNTLGLVINPRCWQVDEFWEPGKTLSRPIDRFITTDGSLLSPDDDAKHPLSMESYSAAASK